MNMFPFSNKCPVIGSICYLEVSVKGGFNIFIYILLS